MQTLDTMEVCSTVTTKKLSSLAKLIHFTIQKVSDASRHKLLTTLDPQLLAKRGKILRKSLNDAVSTSHSRITCRQDVRSSYISPVPIQLDYEFSCSSTPPRRSYATTVSKGRRSNGSHNKPLINKRQRQAYIRYNTLPKVRDSIWDRHVTSAVFPDVASSTGTMESCHVDRAAEEFIQRFYRQLRLQKWMMAQEI
ncbi:PREDICTED: uncharacterized protein LOC104729980 [Camelina sativa]|uniref:Uncharacterized protein LOC104729980 n=1 Tax=Camelina sativa TaxID=90675 RepID=A0ABM0UWE5_CAMSA|nr:PREDICTED: uncharacterized protein LOC104729980 [Camelina sativa]